MNASKTRFIKYFLVFFLLTFIFIKDETFYSVKNKEQFEKDIAKIAQGRELPPEEFRTNGCTFWPDGFLDLYWGEYCEKHDLYYWHGGTEEERLKADKELRDSINSVVPGMGDILYLGVRVGGKNLSSLLPWPWGWGYGWNGSSSSPDTLFRDFKL